MEETSPKRTVITINFNHNTTFTTKYNQKHYIELKKKSFGIKKILS